MKTKFLFIVIILIWFISALPALTQENKKGKSDFPIKKGPYLGQKFPGLIPEIFAPRIISHGFHENGIVFSADGNEVFYSTSDNKYTSKTIKFGVKTFPTLWHL